MITSFFLDFFLRAHRSNHKKKGQSEVSSAGSSVVHQRNKRGRGNKDPRGAHGKDDGEDEDEEWFDCEASEGEDNGVAVEKSASCNLPISLADRRKGLSSVKQLPAEDAVEKREGQTQPCHLSEDKAKRLPGPSHKKKAKIHASVAVPSVPVEVALSVISTQASHKKRKELAKKSCNTRLVDVAVEASVTSSLESEHREKGKRSGKTTGRDKSSEVTVASTVSNDVDTLAPVFGFGSKTRKVVDASENYSASSFTRSQTIEKKARKDVVNASVREEESSRRVDSVASVSRKRALEEAETIVMRQARTARSQVSSGSGDGSEMFTSRRGRAEDRSRGGGGDKSLVDKSRVDKSDGSSSRRRDVSQGRREANFIALKDAQVIAATATSIKSVTTRARRSGFGERSVGQVVEAMVAHATAGEDELASRANIEAHVVSPRVPLTPKTLRSIALGLRKR